MFPTAFFIQGPNLNCFFDYFVAAGLGNLISDVAGVGYVHIKQYYSDMNKVSTFPPMDGFQPLKRPIKVVIEISANPLKNSNVCGGEVTQESLGLQKWFAYHNLQNFMAI